MREHQLSSQSMKEGHRSQIWQSSFRRLRGRTHWMSPPWPLAFLSVFGIDSSFQPLPPYSYPLPCVSMSQISLCLSPIRTPVIGFEAQQRLISSWDPYLNCICKDFFFFLPQIKLRLQVLGLRTWTYLFGDHYSTHDYICIFSFIL